MIRRIIHIDEEKCNGCGACADACHEGAIAMVDGKAKLMRDDYCDGLGDCLPACPTGAITFVEREAAAYDEQAVLAAKAEKQAEAGSPNAVSADGANGAHHAKAAHGAAHHAGCPGHRMMRFNRDGNGDGAAAPASSQGSRSQLGQWPVQIKLVPVNAPYLDGAHLLVAADCTAYAYARMHDDFMRGRITLIGCPKLDDGDYSEKLTDIFRLNRISSVTVVRMEVPCCGGLEHAVRKAVKDSLSDALLDVVTVSVDGKIIARSI